MATAFVPSYRLLSSTSLQCDIVFSGSDVAGGSITAQTTVTGLDLVNDNAAQLLAKIATAVRTASGELANGSGGRGFTVGANQVVMPGLTKG